MSPLDAVAKGIGPSRLPWGAAVSHRLACFHTRVDAATTPVRACRLRPRPHNETTTTTARHDWSIAKRGIKIRYRELPIASPKEPKKPAKKPASDDSSKAAAKARDAKLMAAKEAPTPPPPPPLPPQPPPPSAEELREAEVRREVSQMTDRILHRVATGTVPAEPEKPFVPGPRPKFTKLNSITLDSFNPLYSGSDRKLDPTFDDGMYSNDAATMTQIREDIFTKPRKYVAVIIDADSLKFKLDLIREGFEGGQTFYRRLSANVSKHLELNQTHEELATYLNRDHTMRLSRIPSQMHNSAETTTSSFNISLRLFAFCNLQGLSWHLKNDYSIFHETFAQFRRGVATSSPWAITADAGNTPQAADYKVKAHMLDMLSDRDCFHVYLGGLDDQGYAGELDVLKRFGLLHRVSLVFMPGPARHSRYYEEYAARAVEWTDCFDGNPYLDANKSPWVRKSEVAKKKPVEAEDPKTQASTPAQAQTDTAQLELPPESSAVGSEAAQNDAVKDNANSDTAEETPATDVAAAAESQPTEPTTSRGSGSWRATWVETEAARAQERAARAAQRSADGGGDKEAAWVEGEAERVNERMIRKKEKRAARRAAAKARAKAEAGAGAGKNSDQESTLAQDATLAAKTDSPSPTTEEPKADKTPPPASAKWTDDAPAFDGARSKPKSPSRLRRALRRSSSPSERPQSNPTSARWD